VRGEVTEIPADGFVIIASGPLTSDALAERIRELTGPYLYFYDAIAPIVAADSIDLTRTFSASRYGKGDGDDYLNCPLNEEEYRAFVAALSAGEKIPVRDFEKVIHFEGCMPVEELAERGLETLRFGPMKPVGLVDPRTGAEPHAVVQLRKENRADPLQPCRFQTAHCRAAAGLSHARDWKRRSSCGWLHARNTFINAPQPSCRPSR
jgi:methylenetetrahydrofolate--tRNA-(uracil-5-)-methyltransferase